MGNMASPVVLPVFTEFVEVILENKFGIWVGQDISLDIKVIYNKTTNF